MRSTLKYASTVWDPHLVKDIMKLEAVQRRAAHFVVGDFRRRSSVTEMLQILDWSLLEERRKNARLIMLHKIIRGGTPIAAELPLFAPASRQTRAENEHKFKRLTANTMVYKQSFFARTIRDRNSMPQDYINRVTGGSSIAPASK